MPFTGNLVQALTYDATETTKFILERKYGADGAGTLTKNTTLQIEGVPDGHSGTVLVTQDAGGGNTLSFLAPGHSVKIFGTHGAIDTGSNKSSSITYKKFGSTMMIVIGHEN